jgi:hypothetical protein
MCKDSNGIAAAWNSHATVMDKIKMHGAHSPLLFDWLFRRGENYVDAAMCKDSNGTQ